MSTDIVQPYHINSWYHTFAIIEYPGSMQMLLRAADQYYDEALDEDDRLLKTLFDEETGALHLGEHEYAINVSEFMNGYSSITQMGYFH